MKSQVRTTATLLASAVVGTAIVLAETPTLATVPSPTVARAPVTETMMLDMPWTGGHMRYLDQGKKGEGVGDMFLGVGGPILDHATGDRIGSADFFELIVSGRHHGTVVQQVTLRLPGGHIDIDGLIRHTDKPIRQTITGGTGRYAGVGGQLVLLREDARHKREIMKLELVY